MGSAPSAGAPQPSATTGNSALVAAILNLFFGVGYLYLGYKRVLGVPAVVFVFLALIIYILLGFFTLGLASLIIAVLLAVDGWQKGSGAKGYINAE